ncbi:hypothetical protein M0Q39_03845 [Patescibacteria group bacterium]|nr:hypothetical protein [Patescibacteria group bacterium]
MKSKTKKLKKERLENKSLQIILKRAKLKPEENKEFDEAMDEIIKNLNRNVIK